MSQDKYCTRCGKELIPDTHFCTACGTQLSFKDKLAGLKRKLNHRTKSLVDRVKNSLDSQISDYLTRFNSGEPVKIANVTIPEGRQSGVQNALRSFQDKYLGGNPEQSAEYQQWIEELPNRLEDHKCIVCFSSWNVDDQDNIVVCPHCNSGGHRMHIENWIKSKNYCPLCREDVTFTEFIRII